MFVIMLPWPPSKEHASTKIKLHKTWHKLSVGQKNKGPLPSLLVDEINCAHEGEKNVTFFLLPMHSQWSPNLEGTPSAGDTARDRSPSSSKWPFPWPPFATFPMYH